MIFSHHNTDALSDGKPHDAFDVFRILEHGGDLISALHAAAALLNMTYHPAKDAAPSGIEMDEKRPPPWFKEFAADRMANATYRQLSLAERGLLDTLRREYWVSGVEGINPDPRRLARLTGYTEKEISKALPAILSMFQTDDEGLLCDEDLLRQYDELCRRRQKRRFSGRKGGQVSASRRTQEEPPF